MTTNPVALEWSPLRTIRHKLAISQKTTGALVGLSGSMISKIEHNRRGVSAAQLVGLAIGLGTPMYDLFIATVKKP